MRQEARIAEVLQTSLAVFVLWDVRLLGVLLGRDVPLAGSTQVSEVVGGECQQIGRVANGRGPACTDERHDVGYLLPEPGQHDALHGRLASPGDTKRCPQRRA